MLFTVLLCSADFLQLLTGVGVLPVRGAAAGAGRASGAMFQMVAEVQKRICFTTGGICPHREDVVPLCVTEGFCGGKRGPKTGIERRVHSPTRAACRAPRAAAAAAPAAAPRVNPPSCTGSSCPRRALPAAWVLTHVPGFARDSLPLHRPLAPCCPRWCHRLVWKPFQYLDETDVSGSLARAGAASVGAEGTVRFLSVCLW